LVSITEDLKNKGNDMFNPENEKRFFKMLEAAPELKQYWDIKESMPKMNSIQASLHRKPKEESTLLRFYGSVWFGSKDMFNFDFMIAAKYMDERELKIVRRWLLDPFFG